MQLIAIIALLGAGFIVGIFTLYGYMLYRMMRNDGWDDSNINNAQRLLSHVVLHAEDFGKMYYIPPHYLEEITKNNPDFTLEQPFWYINKDEFQGVVKTRPTV